MPESLFNKDTDAQPVVLLKKVSGRSFFLQLFRDFKELLRAAFLQNTSG